MSEMKNAVLVAAVLLVGLVAVVYCADWAGLHLRSNPYDSVTVQHYFAIPQKTGKVELHYDRTYNQTCARSLFPHSGYQPCWYLRRHTEQWTTI